MAGAQTQFAENQNTRVMEGFVAWTSSQNQFSAAVKK
jgi:hypothetical protein